MFDIYEYVSAAMLETSPYMYIGKIRFIIAEYAIA